MKKTIFWLCLWLITTAQVLAQETPKATIDSNIGTMIPGGNANFINHPTGRTLLRQLNNSKPNSSTVATVFDSLATYVPGQKILYNGHRWAARDSLVAGTFPASETDDPNWTCEDCITSGGSGVDLSDYARKDEFSTLMQLNVEDYDVNWFLRPDVSSPSGNFLQGRLDPTRWTLRSYTDSLFATVGGGGGGGHIIRYNNADLTQRPTLQFEGYGVSVSDSVNKTKVTFANPFVTLPNSNNIYVSPAGDDASGQRGDISKPFLTITAAQAVYTTNDVIHINAGVYSGQGELDIPGQDVVYQVDYGAHVIFSGRMVGLPNANVTIRGKGWFTCTDYYYGTSFTGNAELEFDRIDISGQFYLLNGFHHIVGRELDLGSSANFGIQTGAHGTFEVQTFNHLATSNESFIRDYTTFDFYNTTFNWAGMFALYSGSLASSYSYMGFHNCVLNIARFSTLSGTGTSNSLYGRVTFENTTINATGNGMEFLKTQPGTEFWFENARINAGAGHYSMFTPGVSNPQYIDIDIRILAGGLTVNADVHNSSPRVITNLTPQTYAVKDSVSTITPFPSVLTGILVKGEPLFGTAKGTSGQVPIYNADGTVTPGTVSGGGGSGGDADSLGGVPASGYVPATRTVNGHTLSSNVTVTAGDVGLGNVDNTSNATERAATATLTNKTLTSPVINSGSLGSSTVANTQTAGDNSTKVSTTAYADLAADNAKVSTGKTYTQSSHGFVAGDVLKKSGGVWSKAQANSAANAEVLGVVESVTTNTFRLVFAGEITLSGLTTESNYWLSSTTAGATTLIEPTASSTVSKPVFFSISTTTAIVQIQRGITN